MRASFTLSETATPALVEAVAPAHEAPLQQMQSQVEAMRTLVQSQHNQIQTLQALEQKQPLLGFTTDTPWGMALEGLALGAVALALGAASLWGSLGAQRGRRLGAPRDPRVQSAKTEFSDSMLYLADEDGTQGGTVAVSAQLHDPQHDAHGATLAHEEGDAELDYYRMALNQQGLSVTAGAGQVDSERVPLDVLSAAMDLDLELPLEPPVPTRPTASAPAGASVAWDDLVPTASAESPSGSLEARREAAVPESHEQGIDLLDHTDLSESASLLADFSDSELAPYADTPAPTAVVDRPSTAAPAAEQDVLLEWDLPEVAESPAQAPAPATSVTRAATAQRDTKVPNIDVQMQLAIEFRDLGLWAQARERVLEILEQPDTGMHLRARAMLEELAQTAHAPLAFPPDMPDIKDPWG